MEPKFKNEVLATVEIKHCYKNGLSGLNEYKTKVEVKNTRKIDGFVSIDDCAKKRTFLKPTGVIMYLVRRERYTLWKFIRHIQVKYR